MTTCNFACWMVSRPMTRSGRDWDNSAVRLVSRSSSELVSVESFLLILSVSSDMSAKSRTGPQSRTNKVTKIFHPPSPIFIYSPYISRSSSLREACKALTVERE